MKAIIGARVGLAAILALFGCVLRAAESDAPAAADSVRETALKQAVSVVIGPRELIRQRDKMPFIMDSSLATLKRDNESWFFYHSVEWGKSNDKYIGTAADPFQTKVWRKNRDKMYDLNGWYADVHHAGLWLHNIYMADDGNLLGVVHI